MKFMAKSYLFMIFFSTPVVNEIESIDRWKLQIIENTNESVLGMIQQLFSEQTSASIERIIVIT